MGRPDGKRTARAFHWAGRFTGFTGCFVGHRLKKLMGRPDGIRTAEAFHPYGIMTPKAFHWTGRAGWAD